MRVMVEKSWRTGRRAGRAAQDLLWILGTVCLGLSLAACSDGSSGGSVGGKAGGSLPAPLGLVAFAGDGEVTLTWDPAPGVADYNVYWSTGPGVSKLTGNAIAGVKGPYLHGGLVNLTEYRYAVAAVDQAGRPGDLSAEVAVTPRASAGGFLPPWAKVPPTQVLSIELDTVLSAEANGQLLAARIAGLAPGDRLEVGAGTWSMPTPFSVDLIGSAGAPIWIAAAPGTRPTLTRADATDAVVHVGAGGGARYVALTGLELVGGGRGYDLWDAQEVWIDLGVIHGGADTPIAADNVGTQALYVTRNRIDHTGGAGHGIALGTNDGQAVAANATLAQNTLAHCRGANAAGIWVRQGSHGNWIVENLVHDTEWPCILVAGTGTNPWNVIERNVAYDAHDNVVEVQSQALVLNNLMMNGRRGFSSFAVFDEVRELEVVNNTIVNGRRAVNLGGWSGKPGMVFANNVSYSERDDAVRFVGGSTGVDVRGNVVYGTVNGIATGFVTGTGLADFVDLDWKAASRDATPSVGSPIIDSAEPSLIRPEDLSGRPRDMATYESGCIDVL